MASEAIGRSPRGVAMGVVGAAQTQLAQPVGQVPFTGSKQAVTEGPSVTVQQSCAPVQHSLPQHVAPTPQVAPVSVQGGLVAQVPLPQYGCAPAQALPHVPQLRTSFAALTHVPPQHLNPKQSLSD
jgi:hypothetical protein